METITLTNGLKILIIPRPDSESTTVTLVGLAGSGYEGAAAGAAHFLEHLLFDGSQNYSSVQLLNRLTDDVGSRKSGSTTKDTVRYTVKSLPEKVEQSFICLSELLLRPLLSEKDIGREKTIIEQEINRFKDQPPLYLERRISALVYPNHPLGRFTTGDIEDIHALTQRDLTTFWQENYVARNFVLVVAGNISFEKAQGLAEHYFGPMVSGQRRPTIQVVPDPGYDLLAEQNTKLKQAHFLLYFPAFARNDDHTYSADVLGRVLTRGYNSRLFVRLRIEKAMIYSIRGGQKAWDFGGFFHIGTAVDENRLNEALSIINEETKRFITEPISNEELNRGVSFAVADMLFNVEDTQELAIRAALDLLSCGKFVTPQQTRDRFRQITTAEIQTTAKKLFASPPKLMVLSKSLTSDQVIWP